MKSTKHIKLTDNVNYILSPVYFGVQVTKSAAPMCMHAHAHTHTHTHTHNVYMVYFWLFFHLSFEYREALIMHAYTYMLVSMT